MKRAGVILVGAVVFGCGDNLGGATVDGPPGTPDAPAVADAAVDAQVDAAPIDAAAATGRYVLGFVQVPTSSTEASLLGMDIDSAEPGGDVGIDNQLGSVLAAVATQGFDVQSGVEFSVDHGGSLSLFDFRDDDTLHTYSGTDPIPPACEGPTDTICRHHLDGAGSFDLDALAPTGTMPTTAAGSTTVGGPGTAVVDLLLLGSNAPIHLQLIGARFSGDVSETGWVDGRLAGAVSTTQIDTEVIPGVAAAVREQVMIDCPGTTPPGCGCSPGSTGADLVLLFDTDPSDCTITDDEVRTNDLIEALFLPDVNIGGVDALSIGIGISGVQATFRFTPP